MSQYQVVKWLVTYDIANPKRLSKVFRYLKKQGTHLQYSVFIVAANSHQIKLIMQGLEDIINAKHDDVRAYKIPAKNWHVTIGASILPDGTLLGSGSTLSS